MTKKPAQPARYFSVRDVAERLELSEKTIRRHIKDKSLRIYRLGRRLRISEDDLMLFMELRR